MSEREDGLLFFALIGYPSIEARRAWREYVEADERKEDDEGLVIEYNDE